MSTLMEKILTIAAATKRIAWDLIPEKAFEKYDLEMLILERLGIKGKELDRRSIEVYNRIFAEYGYTKQLR